MEKFNLEILESAIQAGLLPKLRKIPHLEKAILSLEVLKIFIRLAYETKTIDYGNYEELENRLQEIGKMLYGWKRSIL